MKSAIIELTEAKTLYPNNLNTRYFLGLSLFAIDSFQKAIDEFTKVINLN